jgi:hypothetical protein
MLNIKVLGIGGTKYFNLIKKLNQAIRVIDFTVQIEYLKEVEDFIKYEIIEIPVLVINEEVIIKGDVLTTEEIIITLIGINKTTLKEMEQT